MVFSKKGRVVKNSKIHSELYNESRVHVGRKTKIVIINHYYDFFDKKIYLNGISVPVMLVGPSGRDKFSKKLLEAWESGKVKLLQYGESSLVTRKDNKGNQIFGEYCCIVPNDFDVNDYMKNILDKNKIHPANASINMFGSYTIIKNAKGIIERVDHYHVVQ